MKKHIVLIGIRASGKSTLGRLLSKKLNIKFFDIDEEIVKKSGYKKMIDILISTDGNSAEETLDKILKNKIFQDNIA